MFTPQGILKNRHLQTLYAPLFRRQPTPKVTIERFELDDGDFVECYWHPTPPTDNRPIIILFHGLAGSFHSPYIQGAMRTLSAQGFAVVLMHFRGCAKHPNRLPRSYHSGDTGDARAWIYALQHRYPQSPLHAVGYSIGGNMLLKLLGEDKDNTPLRSAVSVSAPLDLAISAKQINQGFAKLYQRHLLAPLKKTLLEKYQQFDMEKILGVSPQSIQAITSIEEFDEYYTAPINGFKSAQHYYKACSAKAYLQEIHTPTLIIHALDDPFMTPAILPKTGEYSSSVQWACSPHGGHVGFVEGGLFSPRYWLEEKITTFLLENSRQTI